MRRFWFTIAATLCATCAISAQPIRFNYQARLTDPSGAPLTGAHTLYFSIYQGGDANTASSGTATFLESDAEVLTNGIVSHSVGTGITLYRSLDATQFEFNGDIFLQVSVDNYTNFLLPRTRLDPTPFAIKALDAPATLFGQFGGYGTDGDFTVSGDVNFIGLRNEFGNFTVPAGTTITASQGWEFIAVQGTCTIAGAVSATGTAAPGGDGATSSTGGAGNDASGIRVSNASIDNCASGAGGGGGGTLFDSGGNGGGAQGTGGAGSYSVGGDGQSSIRPRILAGGVTSVAGSGQTLTGNFQSLLLYLGGAGGGGGSTGSTNGGNGGAGGGVIYIECNELVFTGTLQANGTPGGSIAIFDAGAGAGGGGGGGVILVRARKITTNTGTVSTKGAPGGTVAGGATSFNGGNGGDGFWDTVEIH